MQVFTVGSRRGWVPIRLSTQRPTHQRSALPLWADTSDRLAFRTNRLVLATADASESTTSWLMVNGIRQQTPIF